MLTPAQRRIVNSIYRQQLFVTNDARRLRAVVKLAERGIVCTKRVWFGTASTVEVTAGPRFTEVC